MSPASSTRMLALVVAGGAAARAAAELAAPPSSHHATESHHHCGTVGSHCAFLSGCCDGLDCWAFFSGKCQARCVDEVGGACGGHGDAQTVCCGDMQCEGQRCVLHRARLEECTAKGDTCACVGCPTTTCCGGLTCGEVMGQGGERYCVDLPGAASSPAAANATAPPTAASAEPPAAAGPPASTAPFYP